MTIGERLRETRKARGLTLRDVAKSSGVSAATVCRVENGAGDASVSSLRSVAEGLGFRVALVHMD